MLPKIEDILVATGLSGNSDNALRYALSIAQASNAKVHLLHVMEPMSQDAMVTMRMFMQDDETRKSAMSSRHDTVKQLLTDNQKAFVKNLSADEKGAYASVSSVELVDGHPAEEIIMRAKKLSCGLIVMGTHEHGTGHTFLGTVVKKVLRRSPIPTMVVPHMA
jgi:nucleotide-binding universal stress UspA family protein